MRVAIAGAGNVGQHVAASLLEAAHEVLLIEQNQNVVDRATLPSGIEWYVGDACDHPGDAELLLGEQAHHEVVLVVAGRGHEDLALLEARFA